MLDTTMNQLRALRPPVEDEETVDAILDAYESANDVYEELFDAILDAGVSPPTDETRTLWIERKTLMEEAWLLSSDYGLHCFKGPPLPTED